MASLPGQGQGQLAGENSPLESRVLMHLRYTDSDGDDLVLRETLSLF